MKNKIIHIRLPEKDYINIKDKAEKRNRNLSEYIREVLSDVISEDVTPLEVKFPWLKKVKKHSN